MIRERELSKYTAPGRHGFFYAVELDMSHSRRSGTAWHTRMKKMVIFLKQLERQFGRDFQKHWQRKQVNRRWYYYSVGRTYRICFRSERDRTLALLMYK